ncbi:GIY-YIG nuclease family protein [Candidatus Parcubacteria bacterium]|nr:GIY-YIG nuclease family protein [Candidatus Parcubacteria bacterium]
MPKEYFVYIATNKRNTVFYTGVTNDIMRRMHEHRNGSPDGFTIKYRIGKLVYSETFPTAEDAISAEKKIKAGSRQKKIALIESRNPSYQDLLEIASLRSQ